MRRDMWLLMGSGITAIMDGGHNCRYCVDNCCRKHVRYGRRRHKQSPLVAPQQEPPHPSTVSRDIDLLTDAFYAFETKKAPQWGFLLRGDPDGT